MAIDGHSITSRSANGGQSPGLQHGRGQRPAKRRRYGGGSSAGVTPSRALLRRACSACSALSLAEERAQRNAGVVAVDIGPPSTSEVRDRKRLPEQVRDSARRN